MKSRDLCALAACLAASLSALAEPSPPQRLVVKLQVSAPDPGRESAHALRSTRAIAAEASYVRATVSGGHVVQLPEGTTAAQALEIARRLRSQPGVQRAELDARLRSHEMPAPAPAMPSAPLTSDTYSLHQWPLMNRAAGRPGRANFEAAWLRTGGSPSIVVAVLDSGTTHHPDTVSREWAGFDMVTDLAFAADGSGRDADATDPGDFCAGGIGDSDWHGTAAAGLIGAIAGNGYAVAGAADGVTLQHVRVLGRCGAWSSDVADAIVWAAGGEVPGLPRNATPARVVNLSLGAVAGCARFMQDAVDEAVRRGAVIVASAGNDARPGIDTPANCRGVLAVAAGTESGDLARYSNHSPAVALTAPAGGECRRQGATCLADGTATVGTVGRTLFEQHAEVRYFGGTSAAAPHVAAAAALVLSANPALTPSQVGGILRATASRAYPEDSFCAEGPDCGAGFLDAEAAVMAADRPVEEVAASFPPSPPEPLEDDTPDAAIGVAGAPDAEPDDSGGGALSLAWSLLLALAAAALARRGRADA